uniref:Serine/threonine-protein kinase ATM n=1 Tax=Glossina palpalis gambiensis TaxID=67801 RepID=A0A1B0BG36_9MUSC
MSNITGVINKLCAELRSEKISTRNKAAEELDNHLSSSKNELLLQLAKRRNDDVSWTTIFKSGIDATIKHAIKADAVRDSKNYSSMRNKSVVYKAILNKLINYNLEGILSRVLSSSYFDFKLPNTLEPEHLLSKDTLFEGFQDGFRCKAAVRLYSDLFLNILNQGIFKSQKYVRELKLNEISIILSYLFDTNNADDHTHRFAALKVIIKTIELSQECVLMNTDVMAYFPEVTNFVAAANDDSRKADTIKLYYLMVSQNFVDYHHTICHNLQNIVPALCGFYQYNMQIPTKEMLFKSLLISLEILYPYIHLGDVNVIKITLNESWPKTLKKLKTLIEIEIKQRNTSHYYINRRQKQNDKGSFTKLAALAVYLVFWSVEEDDNASGDALESRCKLPRSDDKLEIILNRLQEPTGKLSILAELIVEVDNIINISNYQALLKSILKILRTYGNARNLRHIRLCLKTLLVKTTFFTRAKSLPVDYCHEEWLKIIEFVLADTASDSEIIYEKQLLINDWIVHQKLNASQCVTLMTSYMANPIRRTEYVITVRHMLQQADQIGLDKTSELITRCIRWLCSEHDKNEAKSMLMNIEPIKPELIFDTCAIAVTNIVNASQFNDSPPKSSEMNNNLELLLYKYNRDFVAIKRHGRVVNTPTKQAPIDQKNCVFQSNYEFLMNILNYETSKSVTTKDILRDLTVLYKMTLLMKSLLQYGIFDEKTYTDCPLIKRIGLFLSHLELQFKSNRPKNIESSALLELFTILEKIVSSFTTDSVLLHYLEMQPIEEMIEFIDSTLKYIAKQYNVNSEHDDWSITNVTYPCLRILAMLCASTTHCPDVFKHIVSYSFGLKKKEEVKTVLSLTRILCSQKSICEDIADWFVDKLKIIFKYYHTDVELIEDILSMIPAIFIYVNQYEHHLDNMLLAVFSLLKISFRKSYSSQLITRIIESVSTIARGCRNIFMQENFKNICLSVVKFLTFNSLEIQFATVNTLTALMDINWHENAKIHLEIYHEFCDDTYKTIEWKKLRMSTTPEFSEDQLQNDIAVNVQLLISLLTFSCFHREVALRELFYMCALYKLTDGMPSLIHCFVFKSNLLVKLSADLHAFRKVADYCKTNLTQLVKPYIFNTIDYWIKKSYPISKFPFYLGYETKDDFIQNNIREIVTCLLLHNKSDELQKLEQYGTPENLIEVASPMIRAFVLCGQCESNQNTDLRENVRNILKLNLNLSQTWNASQTFNYLLKLLMDDNHARSVLGFSVFYQSPNWYNIDYNTFKYVTTRTKHAEITLCKVIVNDALSLIETFRVIKKNCTDNLFDYETLGDFYRFFVLADMATESFNDKNISSASIKYFARDLLLFNLYILEQDPDKRLESFALFALEIFLQKYCKINESLEIVQLNSSYIFRVLRIVFENNTCGENQKKTVNIINALIESAKISTADKYNVVLMFSDYELFSDVRLEKPKNTDQYESVLKKFVESKDYISVEHLKVLHQHILKHKGFLQNENNLLYKLLQKLLQIVKHSHHELTCFEALKCLGEIGPLNLTQDIHYFEANTEFDDEFVATDPLAQFCKRLYIILEKLLQSFHAAKEELVIHVAQYLVNSKMGIQLLSTLFKKQLQWHFLSVFIYSLADFPCFHVFRAVLKKNYLDFRDQLKPLDWLATLKRSETLGCETWMCQFVSEIFEQCEWTHFRNLATQDFYFSESILSSFVEMLIKYHSSHVDSIIVMLDYFFNEFMHYQAGNGITRLTKQIYKEKRVIIMMLRICECIRIHNNWCLPLQLLNVARACNYCQAFFLSIMYLEMWSLQEKESSTDKTNFEIVSNEHFQEIAKKSYESIGCTDAISGFINPLQSRIDYLNLTNNWADILIEATDHNDMFTSILKHNGVLDLADAISSDRKVDYEICWRLCRWDTAVEGHSRVNTLNDIEEEFQKHHFNSLKCIYYREENNSLAAIKKARDCILSILKEISVECLQSVYKYLTWLQMLQQTDDFCLIQFFKSSSVNQTFEKWQMEANDLRYGNFQSKELILSHQVALFNTAGIRTSRKIQEFYKEDPIEKCLLKCIHECKNAGKINLAKHYVSMLKNKTTISENHRMKICALLEDAEICMKTGKAEISKTIFHHISNSKDYYSCLERVRAMQMNGEYLMETNTEAFELVLTKYFQGSLQLLRKFDDSKEAILKKFPNQFDLREFPNIEAEMEHNRQAVQSVNRGNADRDKMTGVAFMNRFSNIDEKEINQVQEKLTRNLCVAIENYIKFCCLDTTVASPAIYRIIALWFANKRNQDLRKEMEENIDTVPSYKFVCVLNQLTAHLNSKNKDFLQLLKNVIIRCAREHPQQTLCQLYPLIYAHLDGTQDYSDDRSHIAQDIIANARDAINVEIITQLGNVIPALIEFANENVDTKSNNNYISEKLKNLKNLDEIQCPTIELPVRIDLNYNITSIIRWEKKISLVGGINAPKKLSCVCSDGITRAQLLKGKDDLRQDAVMQQAFCMINHLLEKDPEAVQRQLKIRTYKVMPLSTRTGILQWCENTTPIGSYLGDAHRSYRPKDYTVGKCRLLSKSHLKSNAEKRLEVFTHICENIKPVFHYFFFEKFLQAVGYILGLGDRHAQNILIDEKTAELIHIDFGIAFEQGKIMPTPETVPFRLTRDMLAPMGINGPQGVFKKSCETTMIVLRRHQEVITTILEVLLYDPLYIWKVVPQIAKDTEDDVGKLPLYLIHKLLLILHVKNFMAQRALLIVQNKLEGKQAGISGVSSVKVQVERIINEATSNRNLCLLFPGWDPYL